MGWGVIGDTEGETLQKEETVSGLDGGGIVVGDVEGETEGETLQKEDTVSHLLILGYGPGLRDVLGEIKQSEDIDCVLLSPTNTGVPSTSLPTC